MDRLHIISAIKANESALKAEGVEHLALFGSRARENARADSDLDILIDIAPDHRFSLMNLSGVGILIEEITSIPSQVVLRRSIPPDFAARIVDDLVTVF